MPAYAAAPRGRQRWMVSRTSSKIGAERSTPSKFARTYSMSSEIGRSVSRKERSCLNPSEASDGAADDDAATAPNLRAKARRVLGAGASWAGQMCSRARTCGRACGLGSAGHGGAHLQLRRQRCACCTAESSEGPPGAMVLPTRFSVPMGRPAASRMSRIGVRMSRCGGGL